MHIDAIIQSIDKDIEFYDKRKLSLLNEKSRFSAIKDRYPDASIHGKSLCVNDIWDKQVRMNLKPEYKSENDHWVRLIVAQFPAAFDKTLPDMRIFSGNYKNTIATIKFDFSASPRKAEITVLDYSAIVPDGCPSKDKFIDRIRKYIFRHICIYGYQISPNSYDLNLYEKWMMLQ